MLLDLQPLVALAQDVPTLLGINVCIAQTWFHKGQFTSCIRYCDDNILIADQCHYVDCSALLCQTLQLKSQSQIQKQCY